EQASQKHRRRGRDEEHHADSLVIAREQPGGDAALGAEVVGDGSARRGVDRRNGGGRQRCGGHGVVFSEPSEPGPPSDSDGESFERGRAPFEVGGAPFAGAPFAGAPSAGAPSVRGAPSASVLGGPYGGASVRGIVSPTSGPGTTGMSSRGLCVGSSTDGAVGGTSGDARRSRRSRPSSRMYSTSAPTSAAVSKPWY